MSSDKKDEKRQGAPAGFRRWGLLVLVPACIIAAALVIRSRMKESSVPGIPVTREVTFAEHIAPVLFEHCTPCHRPGQPAPFILETYSDASDKADRILEAVLARRMPPWQADPRCGPFANARLLTTQEIEVLSQWVHSGKPEGDRAKLPPLPTYSTAWQLGAPDLIATAAVPYRLEPSTHDTYYNLVIPISLDRPRFVTAIEFSPGDAASIHHAFVRFDTSGLCRKLAAESGGVGFPGLHVPPGVFSPESQFPTWQPGRSASVVPGGMNWRLQPGTDLVLQLHLPPVRVPTLVQPSVAFYFSDEPPTRRAYKVRLTSFTFSIPPGATNYSVREELVLPVPTALVALLPHAHRLARRVVVTVTPPDGGARRVLEIPRWDFEWQTDYILEPEQRLPAGTRLAMEFVFSNPGSHPVSYGPDTTDEMAELWALLALASPADYDRMVQAEMPLLVRDTIAYNSYRLRMDPDDWQARFKIGTALLTREDFHGALDHLQRVVVAAPNEAEPHYWTGYVLWKLGRMDQAEKELAAAIRLSPGHGPAHDVLGSIHLARGEFESAARWFREALRLDPNDAEARKGLENATARRGRSQ